MVKKIINNDLVSVRTKPRKNEKSKLITKLAWGDEIDFVKTEGKHHQIKFNYYQDLKDGSYKTIIKTGLIKKNVSLVDPDDNKVLQISFVDVQQGDGIYMETPKGKKILIDGGDNQLFARYLASSFVGTTPDNPLEIDAIVVSHGDADHFSGLTEIFKSEKNSTQRKRLFIHPKRILHNGIVKGNSKLDVDKVFGNTILHKKRRYIADLKQDITLVKKSRLNLPFNRWIAAINAWKSRYPIHIDRVEFGDEDKFSFLTDEKINVQVLGPSTQSIKGKPCLPLLFYPPKRLPQESEEEKILKKNKKRYSASHTINGHSLVLKIKYGNVRFLLSGDLNKESEEELISLSKKKKIDIQSEIFKVPHHGSHDFSGSFIKSVSPVVSVISSGDENTRKEHIHPRSTLVGALGRHSRISEPMIFVTELIAFFHQVGWQKRMVKTNDSTKSKKLESFYAFERTAFGIVHVRTDGKRVLVFTHSGKKNMKEAYSFLVASNGKITFQNVKNY